MKKNIIISICLCLPFLIIGQNQSFKFKHLSLEEGLSQTSITCILKDSRGFMWFGTEDGLNKYDGTNITVYRHLPDDGESLSSSYINTIIEEKDGFLWIGTKNGLNYFNPYNEKFKRYLRDANDAKSLAHNEINALQLCTDGSLLIGTANGLNILNQKKEFLKYGPADIQEQYNVVSLARDEKGDIWILSSEMLEKIRLKDGSFSQLLYQKPLKGSLKYTMLFDAPDIWIGSSKGLVRFNIETQAYTRQNFYSSNGSVDSRDKILSIAKGDEDKLWVGTLVGGLINYNKLTREFQVTLHDSYNRLSLNSDSIRSIFLDENGILWLGTFGGGINKYDPKQFKFEHYKHHPGHVNSLSENTVRSVFLDSDDELWVGTHNGLNRINQKTRDIKAYKYDQNKHSTISSNTVRSLKEDSQGTIWAGTWENGLNSFSKQTEAFKRYISLPGRTDSIGPVRALEIDAQDNIWIGSNGLWQFNPSNEEHKTYFFDQKNRNTGSYIVHSLYLDKNALLWIGTYQNGLTSLDPKTNIIKNYPHDPADSLSISHNYVTSIAEDQSGALWIGTYGGGLNILNRSKGTFEHYNTSNGLLNDVIYSVLVDAEGFIWFTSNAGLGRLDPKLKEFKYFDVEHGIQSEEFNSGAHFKGKNGEFFFGGINGLNAFFPSAIFANKKIAKIVFTDFQLIDENGASANAIPGQHISLAENIELQYDQNTFSFEFAELNYSDNVDNRYEYQLEGFEKDWQNLGKKKLIALGNLAPGTYKLHVRVHDDLTKQTSIGIRILSPIWRSNWAYLSYFLTAVLISILVYRNVMKTRHIRRQFELKIRNWENDTDNQKKNDSGTTLSLKKVSITSTNQKFLGRVIEIVEDHMEDSNFDVEKFADEMYMSRSQLHRKLKGLTGYSASKFIRLIRLKRAAQLLNGNTGTVSEIAYKVGFDNIGYFSKCFRETFGKPPSQYNK